MAALSEHLVASIKKRYIVGLVLIGLSASVACLCLRVALSRSESTALIVNISGRQRMLSQRLGLDALKVDNFLSSSDIQSARNSSESLLTHALEMQAANKKLSSGNLSEDKSVVLSQSIRNLYFGKKNLSQRVNDYTEIAIALSKSLDAAEVSALSSKIIALSQGLLHDLNSAVALYQQEGEEKIALAELVAWAAISLIIVLLLLEARYIFRPILGIVEESRQSEARRIDELSGQVELRTIKLEKANLRLRELTTYDQLTGLKNRTTLFDEIALMINGFARNQGDFGIAYVDIDFFKAINDQHGHAFGDFVLKEFSDLVSENLREYDDFYRLGGEEFVILFKRGQLEGIVSKIEHLRECVAGHDFINNGINFRLSFSCGLFHSSCFQDFNVDQALSLADKALYVSKNSGRNKLTVASPSAA